MRVPSTAGVRGLVSVAVAALTACGSPLRQAELSIESPPVRLAATLYAPASSTPLPAVLLLHGSGPDGRDNAYYRELAEAFGRRGIATLVYDKRGSGASTGDWRTEPFSALVDDAEAVLRSLRQHAWVDPTRVGIWGGSEGATIAPLVAERDERVAFLIVQSMSGVPFGEQYVYQAAREFRGTDADSADAVALVRAKLAYVRDRSRWAAYDSLVRASAGRRFAPYATPTTEDSWWWRWYATKMDVSALSALGTLRIPTLAIWGAEDVLVPADTSRAAFMAARAALQQPSDRVLFIEGGSHTLHVPGLRGLFAGAGLRNRPVHLRAMTAWAATQVERR
jgi:pimeloyl-ACP methyl ester carboxylesterase